MDLLKLVALDRDDLAVVSTHLQDAVVAVGDVLWRPGENRLVIGVSRFDWEGALDNTPKFQRRSTALRFERVNSFNAATSTAATRRWYSTCSRSSSKSTTRRPAP